MNFDNFIKRATLRLGALTVITVMGATACGAEKNEPNNPDTPKPEVGATANTARAIEIIDAAVDNYFKGPGMAMSRYYNPYTGKASDELGSVWMYTSSIEAVNAVLNSLNALKAEGKPELYDANFSRYATLLDNLVDNLEFYAGTYELTSYTGTNTWTVYGVNRGAGKGSADVTGVLNVYDDQMWLVREFLDAYEATGKDAYLKKAEYLTAYVLDGWDCTLDANGKQNGGITWGPGYVTKHSCSNGPMVTPLVKLAQIYKGKSDPITYGVINPDKTRGKQTKAKADYYLEMAKAVYDYQKSHLYDESTGVFVDMMGNDDNGGQIRYEEIDGVRYRGHVALSAAVGERYSYNTGTMVSGAASLYEATKDNTYLEDLKNYADRSFAYFAKPVSSKPGCYEMPLTGFNNWFNCVLLRGYADAVKSYPKAAEYAKAYQNNLDYAYSNHLYNHMLPPSLLAGWNTSRDRNNMEAMFTFAFATEYAVLQALK